MTTLTQDSDATNDRPQGGHWLNALVGLPDVVHQKYPPSTGSQQCSHCGGWILSAQSFWVNNDGPQCPACFRTGQPNTEASDAKRSL